MEEKILAVYEAKRLLLDCMAKITGFKWEQSQNCFRKELGDLVFELHLIFPRKNSSYEYVGFACDFYLWSKNYAQERDGISRVARYSYRCNGDWFDISTAQKLEDVCSLLEQEIKNTMLTVYAQFRKDSKRAVRWLYENGYEKYQVAPRFVLDYIGKADAKANTKAFPTEISKEELAAYLTKPKRSKV